MSAPSMPQSDASQAKEWLKDTTPFVAIALVVALYSIQPIIFLVYRGPDSSTIIHFHPTLTVNLPSVMCQISACCMCTLCAPPVVCLHVLP